MEDIFSLDININETSIIPESAKDDLFKLSYIINEATATLDFYNPWYIEESVNDYYRQKGFIKADKISNVTRSLINMYDGTTDAGAEMYSTEWNLVTKLIALGTKLFKFIIRLISWIPNSIIKLIDSLSDIPEHIKKMISGNMLLYITAGDIETIYKHSVIGRLDLIIQYIELLSKGDTWHTYKDRVVASISNKITFKYNKTVPENDKKLAKKINNLAMELDKLEFNRTEVVIKDANIRALYFGSNVDGKNDNIKFRGIKINDKHQMSYLDALKYLISSIDERKVKLQELSQLMDIKYDQTQANQNWAQLPYSYQHVITDTYKSITSVFNAIAKITKYISIDINTYNKILEKLQKKKAKSNKNTTDEIIALPLHQESAYQEGFFKDLFSSRSQRKTTPTTPKRTELNDDERKILNEILPYIKDIIRYDSIKIIPSKDAITHEEDLKSIKKSKIGGIPYWPKGKPWPNDHNGKYYCILQINIDDLKNINGVDSEILNRVIHISDMTNPTGIIQYFALTNNDDAIYELGDGICIWHEDINDPADTSVPYISSVSDLGDLSQFTMAASPRLITFEKCYDYQDWNAETRHDIYRGIDTLVKSMYNGRSFQSIDPDGLIYDNIINYINEDLADLIQHRYSGINTLEYEFYDYTIDAVLIDHHDTNHNVLLGFELKVFKSPNHSYATYVTIDIVEDEKLRF